MRFLPTFLSLFLTPLMAVMPMYAETTPVSSAAEASIPGATNPSTPASALQIRLADSGKAVVEANSFVKGYAIAVTDAGGLPVPDVAVAIRLPEDGPTGFFVDGARSAVAYTDASGIAKFAQVNWGATLGTVSIRVTAAKGELHAGALLEQTIVAHSASAPKIQSTPLAIAKTDPPKPAPLTPGTPASIAAVHSGADAGQSPNSTTETAASAEPAVTIVNTGGKSASHSNKKWVILAAVAAGAGVGAALALSGHGGSTTPAAPVAGISIGTPTISLGH